MVSGGGGGEVVWVFNNPHSLNCKGNYFVFLM